MANAKKTNKSKTTKKVKAKAETNNKRKDESDTMDRAALKSVAALLKDAGVDIKVLKGDADDVVQRKVNDALRELPDAEMIRKLESVDPNKMTKELKLGCLGVFIDLSDVSCSKCPDAVTCAGKFIANLKGGFRHLDAAVVTDSAAESKNQAKASEATSAGRKPVTRYQADRPLWVLDRPNPNKKGDDLHRTINRVLKEQPETLGELRAVVERDFDLDGDADFMKFVTTLRDPREGVIKLDVDLDAEDLAALRAAGYEV
jgi:hypothetical protein